MKTILNKIAFYLLTVVLCFCPLTAQESGTIWIKTNEPGSANFDDITIDKNALAFLDSLMKRDDIVVRFLGAADNLAWRGFTKNSKISGALDQTKKLERSLALMKRYGWGEVGITDELIRGVKVVWSPKPPDVFKMKEEIEKLRVANESLTDLLADLNEDQAQKFASIHDTLTRIITLENTKQEKIIEPSFFDWEIKTGLLAWSAGAPYDLFVPSVGILLRRELWAFDLEGGFTPWSRKDELGKRGDAMLMGSFIVFPGRMLAYKAGLFSGWEFLSKTDNWTMKVLGLAAGPSIRWKIFEGFAGYSYSRLSTLTESDRWVSGFIFHLNIKFLVN
ncbi:hypothetical protein H8E88_26880 [candidate division KSB1 bacterium]|nr:hypothetical protein [candidate division KSB1 bacterium]MBL7092824.1 hypothetical protein [candidate division KSB1 bacterium]